MFTFKGDRKISFSNPLLVLILLCFMVNLLVSPRATARTFTDTRRKLHEDQLASIADIVEKAINSGKIPGAVVLIGNDDKVIYRRAFGHRALVPDSLPMTLDTIFDLASLTKVVATSTAVMQLVEKGKLRLENPVARYWPEFKANGKKHITIRHLLTHYSGLRPDLNLRSHWSGRNTAIKKIIAEKPVCSPGKRFIYSDINFEILGELVHRISGEPLDEYCAEHIFKPLGMRDTGFTPSPTLNDRIAPTQYQQETNGRMLCGEVHDPTAYRMGGVAGHAGLFSTADDLSIFAQMLLNDGSYNGVRILSPLTVEKMTKPQTPSNGVLRGLGWNIYMPFASKYDIRLPSGFYGHTGYTGTSLWIDPVSKTYVIILTNRVHPDGHGDAGPLRAEIASLITRSIEPLLAEDVIYDRRSAEDNYEITETYGMDSLQNGRVQTGIDVLESEKFAALSGLRVGLITNHSGLDSAGQHTLDLLYKAPNLKLVAIFSPEHGLTGKVDEKVASITETITGLPVYSLYGDADRPTGKMLEGLDVLVFDIQDIGARFYTYITTMGYAMEAAARNGIAFYVLDRPNPINGSIVQGPIMDEDLKSFVGYFPLPIRYGMTVGELARMFNIENKIGAKLHVIRMHGYDRTRWYDETGLLWVNPSPSIRSLTQAILYPGVAMVEGTNVSVGRGTETPFELFGAPWVNAKKLASYLNRQKIHGVRFKPVSFRPSSNRYKNKLCYGVRIILTDRNSLDPAALGIEIIAALHTLFPKDFQPEKTLPLVGSHRVLQAIKDGKDPHAIALLWQEPLERFRKLRSKYLLY